MADLPTNLKDDILDSSVNIRRRYRMIENPDGTVEFEDMTEYSQVGDEYGAGLINETNRQVNARVEKAVVVRDLETIGAITQEGFIPDALALKDVNNSLGDISGFTNEEYSSLGAFLQYCIDNGYLPNVNVQTYYLYNNGVVNTDIIESLTTYGVAGGSGTSSLDANKISISATGNANGARRQGVYTPKINLSSATKITCTYTMSNGATLYLVALNELADEGNDITNAVNVGKNTSTSGVVELNTVGLSGEYYIYAMLVTPQNTTSYSATITEMTITM